MTYYMPYQSGSFSFTDRWKRSTEFPGRLTYRYLRLSHQELGEQYGNRLHKHTSLNTEDSFLQNYKKSRFEKSYKSEKAYILKGSLFRKEKWESFTGTYTSGCSKTSGERNTMLRSMNFWWLYLSGQFIRSI